MVMKVTLSKRPGPWCYVLQVCVVYMFAAPVSPLPPLLSWFSWFEWCSLIAPAAVSGGMIAPFLYPNLKWDFSLKSVVSISVSGHK